jgi:hypothetical protein
MTMLKAVLELELGSRQNSAEGSVDGLVDVLVGAACIYPGHHVIPPLQPGDMFAVFVSPFSKCVY